MPILLNLIVKKTWRNESLFQWLAGAHKYTSHCWHSFHCILNVQVLGRPSNIVCQWPRHRSRSCSTAALYPRMYWIIWILNVSVINMCGCYCTEHWSVCVPTGQTACRDNGYHHLVQTYELSGCETTSARHSLVLLQSYLHLCFCKLWRNDQIQPVEGRVK